VEVLQSIAGLQQLAAASQLLQHPWHLLPLLLCEQRCTAACAGCHTARLESHAAMLLPAVCPAFHLLLLLLLLLLPVCLSACLLAACLPAACCPLLAAAHAADASMHMLCSCAAHRQVMEEDLRSQAS
jgi:hypothetical protein